MDVEESIRGNPIDGVVLLVGCDKTTPAPLMGAASVDLPAIVVSGGPMLNGRFRGQHRLGHGCVAIQRRGARRQDDAGDFMDAESRHDALARHLHDHGHRLDHGLLVEALGMALPFNAAIPAVDARRHALRTMRAAHRRDGSRGPPPVEDPDARGFRKRDPRQRRDRRIDQCGGAPAGHSPAGSVSLKLDDFDRMARDIPLLVDLMPSGKYLMEDFYYAGGLPAVMRELGATCTGMR